MRNLARFCVKQTLYIPKHSKAKLFVMAEAMLGSSQSIYGKGNLLVTESMYEDFKHYGITHYKEFKIQSL